MQAEEARDEAQMAYDEALKARNISESSRNDLEALLNEITDVISDDERARPDQIEAVSIYGFFFMLSYIPTFIFWLTTNFSDRIANSTALASFKI